MANVISRRERIPFRKQLNLYAYFFLLPAFTILILFRFAPIIMAARLSFFDAHLLRRTEEFIGAENYQDAFQDPALLNSLKVTGLYILMQVPAILVISLGLAILVNRSQFGIGLIRSAPLMAVVMPMSIAAVLWALMYHPTHGIINSILYTLNLPQMTFLGSRETALPSIVVMTVWKDVGFYMIFFLAGLQGIPQEYYDSAKVDGASTLQEFWHITIPLLRQTIVLVLVLATVFSFQVFIPSYVMTEGGPQRATDVVVYYMYRVAFRFLRMGYANAIAIITLVIIFLLSLIQLRLSRTGES